MINITVQHIFPQRDKKRQRNARKKTNHSSPECRTSTGQVFFSADLRVNGFSFLVYLFIIKYKQTVQVHATNKLTYCMWN